jgi:glyceraldehyde-3-phosphate dehydrogenase/erythrose-4-phosphate dehydrogenase
MYYSSFKEDKTNDTLPQKKNSKNKKYSVRKFTERVVPTTSGGAKTRSPALPQRSRRVNTTAARKKR